MHGLCLGEEAFGKGLAAKREQHQADMQLEWEVATQTQWRTLGWLGVRGHSHGVGVGGRPPRPRCPRHTPTHPLGGHSGGHFQLF